MNQDSPPSSFPASAVTLRDIAKQLGISHTAVALALQDSPRISSTRRLEIQKEARFRGYSPNPMATALAHQRHARQKKPLKAEIAWLNHWQAPRQMRHYKEFNLYWQGAMQSAERCGYHLEEFICDQSLPPSRLQKVLESRNVRGILIPPYSRMPPDLSEFNWDKFCVVRFGHSVKKPAVDIVTSDQLTNSLIAFENIRKSGYERIGYVTRIVAQARFHAGFLMAQSELAPTLRLPPLILPTREDRKEDQTKLASWLKKNRPHAVLTDIAALKEMLESVGYPVPASIGLAALSVLDGNADAGIYQNSEHIGKAAVELLISLIHHNQQGIPKVCRELLIEGRWVSGDTLPPR